MIYRKWMDFIGYIKSLSMNRLYQDIFYTDRSVSSIISTKWFGFHETFSLQISTLIDACIEMFIYFCPYLGYSA